MRVKALWVPPASSECFTPAARIPEFFEQSLGFAPSGCGGDVSANLQLPFNPSAAALYSGLMHLWVIAGVNLTHRHKPDGGRMRSRVLRWCRYGEKLSNVLDWRLS
jgi:hypothetical protein